MSFNSFLNIYRTLNRYNHIKWNNYILRSLSNKIETSKMMQADYTCTVCQTRNSARFSSHSYTKGVVLSECKGCKNRHLIADNLGWFYEKNT